ncbi:MAG: hypothetical protein MAG795_00671 [Candidatus Woesearchaeota archaeon]|nr:hypothetical protein [Candidatus Woesearchaeota archaeon]
MQKKEDARDAEDKFLYSYSFYFFMGKLDKGRCGLCCSLIVRLNKQDINQICKLGFEKKFFVEKHNDEKILKRVNGYCMFVVIKKGIATCSIYEHRPKVCREYECIPKGMQDCKLKRHYSIVDYNNL